jgi:tRNA A37 threonylcarbamoyladenosine modification protein TsaB
MYLFCDPTEEGKLSLALITPEGEIKKKIFKKLKKHISEELLRLINRLVGKALLKGIIVINGPGRFTTLRVALTTLNTIAWTLNIPIIGIKVLKGHPVSAEANIGRSLAKSIAGLGKKKTFSPVPPFYGQKPRITLPKTEKP